MIKSKPLKTMNPEFIFRDYCDEDYPGLMALWEATSLSNKQRGDDEQTINETLRCGGRLLLLLHNDRIIGSSWITSDGRRLYLHHFGIHPAYQGQGLSHHLTKASLAIAGEKNMQIKLEVHRSNKAAVQLYQRYGFKSLGDYEVYIIRNPEEIGKR